RIIQAGSGVAATLPDGAALIRPTGWRTNRGMTPTV
ncbi:hypothetical protein AZZ72_002514, partial [Klebsiella pneumoniae]